MKLFKRLQLSLGLAALCFLISPLEAWAADTPIGATATFVEGEVKVIAIEDGMTRDVSVGDSFLEGDKITTGKYGVVEIRFDNGDLIKIDNDSDLTIKSLHRNSNGSTFSIFKVAFGKIKSRVGKLFDKDSVYQYQSRAAIAGVAGTPDWFFFAPYPGDVVKVYLTGEPGDHGRVYVQGLDPLGAIVYITPGFGTIVHNGFQPSAPFRTSADRRKTLRNLKFHSRKKEEGMSEPEYQGGAQSTRSDDDNNANGANQTFGDAGAKILMNSISRKVSIPRTPSGAQSESMEEGENQMDQGSGLDSGGDEETGSSGPQFFHGTATIDLR